MLSIEKRHKIQESLRALAQTHALAVAQIEETISILEQMLELDVAARPTSKHLPVADATTFSITWQDRTCFLGNTLLFWLFHRLLLSPNRYVAHIDLLDDVWKGDRETSTIRGVAKRLRDKLAAAEMKDLAESIDGTVAGYYGLILV